MLLLLQMREKAGVEGKMGHSVPKVNGDRNQTNTLSNRANLLSAAQQPTA